MGSLNPENEPKQEFDDSGYVQEDGAAKETSVNEPPESGNSVNLLDLSDDVLLYILQYCSPIDLKALGFTCSRLGTLILDRTLWQRVDARGTATGRHRMRWLLAHALSVHTTTLKLSGYAREAKGCLGYMSGARFESQPQTPAPMCPTPEEVHPWSLWNRETVENEPPGPRLLRLCAQALPRYGGGFPYWPEQMRGSSVPPRGVGGESAGHCCPGPQVTLTHAALCRLSSLCSKLTELALEHVVIDCNMTKIGMFPKSLRKLSLLGTKCFNLEKSLLFKIHDHLVELAEMDVSECEWLEPACMLPLSKLPRLTSLAMRNCPKLTEFVAYASLATRYGFKQLRVLDLRGSPVGDSEVSALGWVPLLEQLYLSPAVYVPRAPAHAHFSRDPPTSHKELSAWEEQEPEYYKSKYETEDWINEEKAGCSRSKPGEDCSIGSCVLLHHVGSGDQPAPSGSADTGTNIENRTNVENSGLGRTMNTADSNMDEANRENTDSTQDSGMQETDNSNNSQEDNTRKRKQDNDVATEKKHFKKNPFAASQVFERPDEPSSSEDNSTNISYNFEAFSDAEMSSNTANSNTNDCSETNTNSSIHEATSSISGSISSAIETISSVTGSISSVTGPISSLTEPISFINVPSSSRSELRSLDEPSSTDDLNDTMPSSRPLPNTTGDDNIKYKEVNKNELTKGARKHFDVTNCQVSRSTLKDSLDDFKNRTEPGKNDSFNSDDEPSLDDDDEDDDDDDDSPETKRCRLNEGASTSSSNVEAQYPRESKAKLKQTSLDTKKFEPNLNKESEPTSDAESSNLSNNEPNSSSNSNKGQSPDSSQSTFDRDAGPSVSGSNSNDPEANNSARIKVSVTSNKNTNEPSTTQETNDNQNEPQRFVRFPTLHRDFSISGLMNLNYFKKVPTTSNKNTNEPSTSQETKDNQNEPQNFVRFPTLDRDIRPSDSGSKNSNDPETDKPARTSLTKNRNEPSTSQETRDNQKPQRFVRFRMNQPPIFFDGSGDHDGRGSVVIGPSNTSNPPVVIGGCNPPVVIEGPRFEGCRNPPFVIGCRNQPPVVIGCRNNQPPVVIGCGNNQPPFIGHNHHNQPPIVVGCGNQAPLVIEGCANRAVVIEGCSHRDDNHNVHNNNDVQQPDLYHRMNMMGERDGESDQQGPQRPHRPPTPPNTNGQNDHQNENDLTRHRILYVNVGRRRHAMYQISMPEPVDLRSRPLTAAMNLIYSSHIVPRLDYTSLVTDAAIRRFGRADGENINYVQIGPNGPVPAPFEDPHARPNRSNLRVLSVTGFRHITNTSLTHLATAAPHLQSVDFTGTRVTESGVEHFRNFRPDCRVRYGSAKKPKEDTKRPHSR